MKSAVSTLLLVIVGLLLVSCGSQNEMESPATLTFESAQKLGAHSAVQGVAPAVNANVQTLDRYYNFVFTGNYYLNWGGLNETWFWSRTLNGWVYLLPSGDLHQWARVSQPPRSRKLLARGLQAYVADPMGIIEPAAPTANCGPDALKVGGGCWYVSYSGDRSCNAACATHGGYDDLTRTYAGAKFPGDRSNEANCRALVAKVNKIADDPGLPPLGLETPGVGCTIFGLSYPGRAYLNNTVATTAAATPNSRQRLVYRICACKQ